MAGQLSLAASLLDPGARSPAEASRAVTQLVRDGIGLRRKLEARVARAALSSTDPRLICEAAVELHEVVRQVTRVVRCREWLRLEAPPAELRDLEIMGGRSVRLVAEIVSRLGRPGAWLTPPADAWLMKADAVELYDRGVAATFADSLDPLEVLRRKALYDLLLGVVLSSDGALTALHAASLP